MYLGPVNIHSNLIFNVEKAKSYISHWVNIKFLGCVNSIVVCTEMFLFLKDIHTKSQIFLNLWWVGS